MDDIFTAKRKSMDKQEAEQTISSLNDLHQISLLTAITAKTKATFADQMIAMGSLVHLLEMYHEVGALLSILAMS